MRDAPALPEALEDRDALRGVEVAWIRLGDYSPDQTWAHQLGSSEVICIWSYLMGQWHAEREGRPV